MLSALALTVGLLAAAPASAFDFFDVTRRAKALANEKYKAPSSALPKELRELKYADYQQIRIKPDRQLWADGRTTFQVAFLHQGMAFDLPIKINEIDAEGVREIKYDPDDFDFGTRKPDLKQLKNLGFAGFRVFHSFGDRANKRDGELASFLGASYFRVAGKGQVFGVSARGLAIDTAVASGEEFPRFREFWIARPANNDKHLVIYALLDSPRATGAYRFTINPDEDTTVQVRSRVYLRAPVGKLGIAAMSSMYLYGSAQPSSAANFRPELHNSDGLGIRAGNGEWLWRPLNNPRRLASSSFAVENPRGFGLQQRSRDFRLYEDLDERYDLRPSLWVEPEGDWGKGRVELLELPTSDETNDNIAAFWVPESPPKPGAALDLNYTLRWTRNETALADAKLARVLQTRRSTGETRGADQIRRPDGSIALMVDFSAPVPAKPKDPPLPVSLNFSTSGNADVLENSLRRNPVTGGWRVSLRLKVKDPAKPVEMRAALVNGQNPVSETWSYQLPGYETGE
ncbi:glucan biosynthesis protein G [Pigmentiphaga humi]|uniref:glucan biosynthesis protein G n=1 Tax=Pigmentiphaga humi TaxID=2478468 RepID=UPI002482C485|nr:glucan biosynthesis protein G [Pigmentiphaga humi]